MKYANVLFVTALCFFLSVPAFAQAQNQPQRSPSSETIFTAAAELFEKAEYKKAAQLYGSVHRNDSSYLVALYRKALCFQKDSALTDALQTINLAIYENETESQLDYLLLKADILDDMARDDEVMKLYDSLLKLYPVSAAVRNQKVNTFLRLEKTAEAEALALECVVMNFLNSQYHYKAGLIAYYQGKIVPAMMAFMMAQIVNPAHANTKKVIGYLDLITNVKDQVLEMQQNRTADYPGNFNTVEQILFSKIAFDKNYKYSYNVDDKIFRQLSVMIEKLQMDDESTDPYMQLYVPFYKQVFAQKQIEVMLNHSFSEINLEQIDVYIKKNKQEVTRFTDMAYAYCNLIRTTRTVNYAERNKASAIYYFSDGVFLGKGLLVNDKADGDWLFYHPQGNVKAKGKLVAGEKEGPWEFYYDNGVLQSREVYLNGKLEGPAETYFVLGSLDKRVTYKNDAEEGLQKRYNRFGVLIAEDNYKQGKLHGKSISYFNDGRLKSQFQYTEGKLDGPFTVYYEHQAVKEQGTYKAGEIDGTYKLYYSNGKIQSHLEYAAGKTTGLWSYYHRNGKLSYKVTMTEKGADGEVVKYDDEGFIESKETYKEGLTTGISEYYHKGKKYVYFRNNNRGKTNEVHYVDTSGNELLANKRNGKMWTISYYSPNSFKTVDKTFDQDENLQGEVVYYNPEGTVVQKEFYKDNLKEGVRESWFYNKKIKSRSEFAEDKMNGVNREYYVNGNPSLVSFYDEDVLQDYQYDYSTDGSLQSVYFYKDGEKHGYATVYYAPGRPFYEEKYSNGWLVEMKQFDTLGKPMTPVKFKNGNGIYKLFYPNGKLYYELPLVNGVWQGLQKKYYPNGSVMSEMGYKNDKKEGAFRSYHTNGRLSGEGSFVNGLKTGEWKTYDENGKLTVLEQYDEGNLEGPAKYYEDEKLTMELSYKEGEREGLLRKYSASGNLIYEFYYESGFLVSYSYQDKNKKMVPHILLKNLTGKIIAWYSNGVKSAEIDVASGYYNGRFRIFNEAGIPVYESDIAYGYDNGTIKSYHESGKIKSEQKTAMDVTEGEVKTWFADGKIKTVAVYRNNELHGVCKIYDQSGKLTETQTYFYGYIIDIKK